MSSRILKEHSGEPLPEHSLELFLGPSQEHLMGQLRPMCDCFSAICVCLCSNAYRADPVSHSVLP